MQTELLALGGPGRGPILKGPGTWDLGHILGHTFLLTWS